MSTIVYGDKASAIPIYIGKSLVYIRDNIRESDDLSLGEYMWDETVYTKDEYIQLLSEKNKESENIINVMLGVSDNAG